MEEDLEDLFENAPCGYISTDPGGRIIKSNGTLASWLGYERAELGDAKFQDLLNIAGKIYYETHFAPLLRMQGFFNEVALDLVTRGGEPFPVLVNAVERRDAGGNVQFIRITIFNASERRRYEKELLEARRSAEAAAAELAELNRTLEGRIADAVERWREAEEVLRQAQKMEAIGQMTGGVAHDMNNLLLIIQASLERLEPHVPAENQAAIKSVQMALRGVERATALTGQLLAFARRQPLDPKPVEANRLVRGMSDLLRRTLGETIEMETVLAGGLWPTFADPNQIESAILNLAVNARDAMPSGGRLTIETANAHLDEPYAAAHAEVEPGQYVSIAVSDTGSGMSKEAIAKAFEPFFTTKEPGQGTGLGLSQVHGFVKQSGGHVKIYSEPGKGTTVRIYLPRYLGAAMPVEPQPRPASIPVAEHAETVLVVEDDEDVRASGAETLRELGYRVLEAPDGAAALRLLEADPSIRLLFTDIGLPGGQDGRQLADAARRRWPALKVLFTTGYARNAVVHHGRLDPGVALIVKPYTHAALAAKIRAVLDKGEA